MKQIDIFIINFFSATDCAQAITNLGENPLWNFWVIDNSNDPIAWSTLQDEITNTAIPVQLLRAPKNIGFGNACNILYGQTNADYCLLLNPDARIDAEALISLLNQLKTKKKFAALAPMMRWKQSDDWWIPTVTPQTILHQIYQSIILLHPWLLKKAWQHYYRKQSKLLDKEAIVSQSFLSGAILLLRRSAIAQLSGGSSELFNPSYFMFFEDADLSRRLRHRGFWLGIAAGVYACHLYQHNSKKDVLMQESFKRYEAEHEPTWQLRFKSWWLRTIEPYQQGLLSSRLENVPSTQAALNNALGNRTLIAWSPTPSRMPAIWRKRMPNSAQGLSIETWEHLAPGHYYGVATDQNGQLSWIEFDRR